MKGQYLAVETVFTFGLGLIAAVGVITLFNQYRTGVMEGVDDEQVDIVESEIINSMYALKQADTREGRGTGSYVVDLPDRIAGSEYYISAGRNLTIRVSGQSYTQKVSGLQEYTISGEAEGGDVRIIKDQNQFTLRPN